MAFYPKPQPACPIVFGWQCWTRGETFRVEFEKILSIILHQKQNVAKKKC